MYFLLTKNLLKSPVSLFHLLNIKFNVSGFILSEWCSSQSVGSVLRSETFWILSNYRLPSLFYLATGILKTLCGQCCSWLTLLTCIQFDVLHYISLWALYHRHHGARSILKKELAGEQVFIPGFFVLRLYVETLVTHISNYLPKCSITERVKNNINTRKAIFFTALSADMKVKFRL